MKLVSIIMPTYNASVFLKESIDSVIHQTYENWELIIVDDCSTDNTISIANYYKSIDPRINVISCDSNSGSPSHPRNLGLLASRGFFISFLDADDIWLPTKLKLQVAFMLDNNYDFVCSAYYVMDNEGKLISDFHPPISCDYRDLLIHNSVGCLTVMYIKDRFNFFFPDCGHEDYALWLNILKHTNAVYGIQEPLAKYRLSTNGVSSNKIKNLSFFYYIYNKLEGFSYFRSFLYCIRYAWFAKNKYR